MREHHPLILFESRESGDGGDAGRLLRSYGYVLYGLRHGPVGQAVLNLHPIDSHAPTSAAGPLNIVAVLPGDEERWFA